LFYKLAEGRDLLPDVASASVIDAFLAICVHIISTVKQGVSNRAIKILFSYLKNGNDP
jgi:hypothetical protein